MASPGNVNFNQTIYNVSEGDECIRLFLKSDNSVNMNYTVKVITKNKTAMSKYIYVWMNVCCIIWHMYPDWCQHTYVSYVSLTSQDKTID